MSHHSIPNAHFSAQKRRALWLAVAGACAVTLGPNEHSAALSKNVGRVLMLGFDGADWRTAEALRQQGQMPNLARLRASGTCAPLATTTPAESPVAWAALNSGQNPAKTGVPGFVTRALDKETGDPAPDIGFYKSESRRTEDASPSMVQRVLVSHTPLRVASVAGIGAALVFFVFLAFVLRVRRTIAFAIALVSGGGAAWGGWSACGMIPQHVEGVVANVARVGGFWETAAQQGVRSIVLDGAMGWDRPAVPNAKVLAGLGVPDARGNYGDVFVYTTDINEFKRAPESRSTGSGGHVFRVDERDGRVETFLYGPADHLRVDRLARELDDLDRRLAGTQLGVAREQELRARRTAAGDELTELRHAIGGDSEEGRLALPLTLVRTKSGRIEVSIGAEMHELGLGEWSDWFHPSFDTNALFKVRTLTRVKLLHAADPLTLFVDFIQLDPSSSIFYQPVSQPPSFAGELAKSIGSGYETVGWACLTHAFKDRAIDVKTFLEAAEFTHQWRRKLLLTVLDRSDWELLVDVEATPDRVQHMCYQYADPAHPLYDAAKAAEKVRFFGRELPLSEVIDETYRQMDALIGEALAKLRPEDTLLVCADHGFQSFRRQCNLNNWLSEHGYLAIKQGLVSPDDRRFPNYVDWSKTKAYALGLGMIYLNLEGREGQGIVSRADAPDLIEKLRAELLATEDQGRRAVRSLKAMSEIHTGPYLDREADLMVGFEAGWRVSWSTTEGGLRFVVPPSGGERIPGPSFEDNKFNWSGDHVSVDASLVRGIFASNRKWSMPAEGADLLHIAPTALAALGLPIPPEYDRPALALQH